MYYSSGGCCTVVVTGQQLRNKEKKKNFLAQPSQHFRQNTSYGKKKEGAADKHKTNSYACVMKTQQRLMCDVVDQLPSRVPPPPHHPRVKQ